MVSNAIVSSSFGVGKHLVVVVHVILRVLQGLVEVTPDRGGPVGNPNDFGLLVVDPMASLLVGDAVLLPKRLNLGVRLEEFEFGWGLNMSVKHIKNSG